MDDLKITQWPAITIYQYPTKWEVHWMDADGDPRLESFETFELASRYVEGQLLTEENE